jgi:putative DNA methylase
MRHLMIYRKKLIEVALPLEAINAAAACEKSIRHGHPSTLHLWWARRPLAACRAVLFASLVDDPSAHPEQFPTEAERQRLFRLIEELVQWENSSNERVLQAARAEILKSTEGQPPPVYDPFCGGGSIPLEAQRLGLEAHASDLNPVPVLITKALIEIPPQFAGKPPVNPTSRGKLGLSGSWSGAAGLAEDIRYYGQWMRDAAEKRIGSLYPRVTLRVGSTEREAGSTECSSLPASRSRGRRRWRSDGDCVALGAHSGQSQPGGPRCARAASAVVLALDQDRQEGVGGTAGRPGHDDV